MPPPSPERIPTDSLGSNGNIHWDSIRTLLSRLRAESRPRLLEHEVYHLLALAGGPTAPGHVFVPNGEIERLGQTDLPPVDRVVLKVVSPDVVHKSDAGGVVFCLNSIDEVRFRARELVDAHARRGALVAGVLVAEFVERGCEGLGAELFVGVRNTREFGPVIAAGLGGVETEYLSEVLKGEQSVARGVVLDQTPDQFMDAFRATAAYQLVAGRVRGRQRAISDESLHACFAAFMQLAGRLSSPEASEVPSLLELEVNPFRWRQGNLVPLDGRGRVGAIALPAPPRPAESVRRLIEPERLAVLGVSSRANSFGRIILGNVLACGFDRSRVHVIKPGESQIDGVACVPSISSLPEPVDLLVIAAGAEQLPAIAGECFDSGKVRSVIVIPGGAGETEGSGQLLEQVRQTILRGRASRDGGPVFLGPNSLGVVSRPGRYDTFFIPDCKLAKRRDRAARGVALVSQSGAFIITRMSRIPSLDPALAISIGNQVDLTIADLVTAAGERDDIRTIGVYVEGFSDLDGLAFLHATRKLTHAGKVVVLYKAGRTALGRDAAAGHTASLAGELEVCEAGAAAAGALVARSFAEFEQLLETAAATTGRLVRGTRLGAISNAGFETVGFGDWVRPGGDGAELAALSTDTCAALARVLCEHGLSSLVNVRNPLDLTPMATQAAYAAAARVLLESNTVDALLVAAVPLTPAMPTTGDEIVDTRCLADVLGALGAESSKPIAVVVDAGPAYEPLVTRMRDVGLPVFRSADEAIRVFGRVLAHRAARVE